MGFSIAKTGEGCEVKIAYIAIAQCQIHSKWVNKTQNHIQYNVTGKLKKKSKNYWCRILFFILFLKCFIKQFSRTLNSLILIVANLPNRNGSPFFCF